MAKPQINLKSFMLRSATLAIWLFLCVSVSNSPGFGASPRGLVLVPLILCGITAALTLLFTDRKRAIPLCAFLAGVIALGSLILAWVVSQNL